MGEDVISGEALRPYQKQITASGVGRLLQCSAPWHPSTVVEREKAGEAAIYGTAIHAVLSSDISLAEASMRTGVPVEEIRTHVDAITDAVRDFIAGNNPWGSALTPIGWEVPRGRRLYNPTHTDVTVSPPFDAVLDVETHIYVPVLEESDSLAPGATVYGTADLVLHDLDNGSVAVLDYKTGQHVEPTALTPQMLTLAWLFEAQYSVIVHAPRGEPVRIYAETVPYLELDTFVSKLQARALDIFEGRLAYSPGPECHYCPARSNCPVELGSNIVAANAIVRAAPDALALESISMGEMHLLLSRLESITDAAKAKIRSAVLAGEIVERPDGKTLVATTKSRESLSKSSILRALGPEAGQALIDELKAAGAITESTYQEVRAK